VIFMVITPVTQKGFTHRSRSRPCRIKKNHPKRR
jgi:hypothetical protein